MEIQDRRNQIVRLTITISGLSIALLSFLIQQESSISLKNKILMTSGIILFYSTFFMITRSMNLSFLNLAFAQKRIELLWGLHKKNAYFEDEKLMADEWLNYGGKDWKEPVFINAYRITSLLAIFALIVIWLK